MQSPQELAKKWAENLVRNKASIRAGIEGVTVAPTAKAAAAVNKYSDGCQRAVSEGTFVAGCNRVTLQEWKDKTINKGLANLDVGVRNAETKVASFQQKAMPYYKQAKERAAMVEGTGRAAQIARIEAALDVMEQLRQANVRG